MTTMTPDQIAAHWAQQLAGAGPKIQSGIQGVQAAPGAAAARQKQAYVAGVTAKADKWASNVAAVSLAEWQQAFINKGLPRIASGAQQAQPKFTQFMAKLLPYQKSALSSLPARGNLQQNITRMTQWVNAMAQFQK
jgi:hypothetical protein